MSVELAFTGVSYALILFFFLLVLLLLLLSDSKERTEASPLGGTALFALVVLGLCAIITLTVISTSGPNAARLHQVINRVSTHSD